MVFEVFIVSVTNAKINSAAGLEPHGSDVRGEWSPSGMTRASIKPGVSVMAGNRQHKKQQHLALD